MIVRTFIDYNLVLSFSSKKNTKHILFRTCGAYPNEFVKNVRNYLYKKYPDYKYYDFLATFTMVVLSCNDWEVPIRDIKLDIRRRT